MFTILNEFPLTGSKVSAVLSATASPEQLWVLKDIETLAEPKPLALLLGALWQKTRGGPIELNTADLCAALTQATQVVSLDVQLTTLPTIHLFIEDGVVIECNFS